MESLAQAAPADPKLQGALLLMVVLVVSLVAVFTLLAAMRAWRRYFLAKRETRSRTAALDAPDPWTISGKRLTRQLDQPPESPESPHSPDTPEATDDPPPDPSNN